MVFEFIKKLFKKEPVEIELKESEVLAWFLERAKDTEQQMVDFLTDKQKDFDEADADLREKVKALRYAQLKNPNIPKKELDFMEGNRVALMKRVVLLVRGLILPKNIDELKTCHESIQKSLDDFTKDSYRAYQIVSQFFGEEVGNLSDALRRFGDIDLGLMAKYKELHIDEINNIKNAITQNKESIENAGNLKKELEEKEDSFIVLKERISETESELERLKSSSEFKDYKSNIEKKADVKVSIANHTQIFRVPFSSIEHSLRKYSKMAMKNTEWIDGYLADPIDAIRSDEHLVIFEILEALEKNLAALKLNDKKRARVEKNIDKMDHKYIEGFRNTLLELEDSKAQAHDASSQADVKKHIRDMEKLLETLNDEKKNFQFTLDDIKKRIEKLDVKPISSQLIERMSMAFSINITVI